MARVKYYDQASQEWKYADAALNMKGKDGYTPQKGIDYFTEEDVRELTENVLDQGVLTYNEQELTEDQKAQARENIGIDQISFDKLTEDLDASGFRITNLPIPQSGSEPATKDFVENFTIEGSTYVATDDGEGNVTIRPYLADEDELVFKSHIQNQNNPHNVTAAQVGARPNSWMPTAEEVGATPSSHAVDKNNPHDVTAEQIGALPSTGGDMIGSINMNGQKIYGLNAPTEDDEAATKGFVDAAKEEAQSFTNTQITDRVIYGKGKNLLKNTAKSQTINGVTFTVNDDGSVTANGTATKSVAFELNRLNYGEFVGKKLSGTSIDGDAVLVATYLSTTGTYLGEKYDFGQGLTIPEAEGAAYIVISILISVGSAVNNTTVYPMIRLASETDDTYEPYYEGLKELTDRGMELLWENPSPDSEMSAETAIDFPSGYDLYMINATMQYRRLCPAIFFLYGKNIVLVGAWGDDGKIMHRSLDATSTGFKLNNGYYAGNIKNDVMIPYEIYGFKGVIK